MLKEVSDNKKLQCFDVENSLGGSFFFLCPGPSTPPSLQVKEVINIHILKAWYLQVVKENVDVALT